MRCIFLAVLSHKLNVIFHISTYCIWEFSNPTDASAKNVTLCGSFMELVELNYLCIYTLYYFDSVMDASFTPQTLDSTYHTKYTI